MGWINLSACLSTSIIFTNMEFFKLIIMITNLSRFKLFRMEKLLETNRQLIDCRLAVTEQLITFVKICGELNEQMNKLEMLILDEKQQLDMTVLENSR